MTRKFSRNALLSVAVPFIAVLIVSVAFVALAQTPGAGQRSAQPAVVSAQQDTGSPAQAERPLLPGATDGGRAAVGRSHKNQSGARPMALIPPSFQPVVTYDSGGVGASSLAAGDVNGDGHLDLVVTNADSNSVDVLLGNGDGTFRAAVAYASGGYHPWSVVIGDVNGDGKPDLAEVNFEPGNNGGAVGILLGNGDGTFQSPVMYGAGGFASLGIAIGDLRSNGILDLAVANWCDSSCNSQAGVLGVLLGNGDGTFQSPVSYASSGYNAYSVVIADVNGDGHPDLVAANNLYGGTVGVLLGNGDGTFQPAVTYSPGGYGPDSVTVGDVNGDGYLDLVVASDLECGTCTDGGVSVLLGNGDGTFRPAVTYDSGGAKAFSVAIGDVNGDGYPDLVVTNVNTNSVGILLGNGDGTFQPALTYDSGGIGPYSVAVTDVNGDGKLDLLVANCSGSFCGSGNGEGVVGVLLNDTQYTPTASTISLASSQNPSPYGDETFTATVSAETGTPTGTVEFFDGDVALGSSILKSGTALFYPTWLALGSHSVVAKYPGNGKYLGSTSAPINQVVNQAVTTTSLISSVNPSVFGQTVTFTAQVSATMVKPTGTVEFFDGSTELGSATLAKGSATLSISSLMAGAHSITAAYQGTGNFDPSRSAPLNQVVSTATTTTSLVSSRNPTGVSQPVTYTATVTAQYGGAATGTVMFQDGGTTVATASVANNQATYSTKYTKGGVHPMTAVYSGDTNNLGSASPTLTEYVAIYASKTVVTTSGSPSQAGQAVTFTATVTSTKGTIPDGELGRQ